MVIDMIKYKLAPGISEDNLRAAAEDIIQVWMSKQPGFLGWTINTVDENSYVDFVYWADRQSADLATKNMKDIPPDHSWLKCYDMASVEAQKVNTLFAHMMN